MCGVQWAVHRVQWAVQGCSGQYTVDSTGVQWAVDRGAVYCVDSTQGTVGSKQGAVETTQDSVGSIQYSGAVYSTQWAVCGAVHNTQWA